MNQSKYYKEEQYIHYSNCHEDAEMLFRYGNNNPKTVLSICSALDNSLALLLMDPQKIVTIDTNITQIYLARLKVAAIKKFTYEDYLVFWGINDGDSKLLYESISDDLDPETREYFDNHLFLIDKIKLLNCGRFEYYFQILKHKVMPLIHRKKTVEKFALLDNIEEQKRFYKNRFSNKRFKTMFKLFFSEKTMSRLGRDKDYFKYNSDSLVDHLTERVKLGFDNNLNSKNPYMQYVLLNTFKAMPMYLEKENYEVIKSRLDRLEIRHCSFDDVLLENEKYDLMNLSDIFEYMPNEIMREMENKTAKILNTDGIVMFWNMVNDREMGNELNKIDTSLVNDRCFYYKAFFAYKK